MKILGSFFCCLAIIIFWLCFFVFAPFLCKLVPLSEWKGLIDVIIYIFIAYLGGGMLPIILIIYGLIFIFGEF